MDNSGLVRFGRKFIAGATLLLMLFNSSFALALENEGDVNTESPAIVVQNTEVVETPQEIVTEILENTESPAETLEEGESVASETPENSEIIVDDAIKNTESPVEEIVPTEEAEIQTGNSVPVESNLSPEFQELLAELGIRMTFIPKVELGVTYAHQNNNQVQVTFTKLPENPGSLIIKEVTLTDAQVAEFGATSNIAYDITSDMENGSFEYDLKLPAPATENISKVIFAENVESLSLESAGVVADAKVSVNSSEKTVSVSDLDHFTVYMVVRTAQDFAGLTWTADRQTPSGGWAETLNTLVMNIDASEQAPGAHERTEGVQANIPAGKNSVKAKLYIDTAWNGVDYVRAGLWGKVARVINPANNDTAWPIMEFTNVGGNPRVRVYDTMVTGTWTDVGNVSYGDTVDFEVLQNPYTSKFEFYLNGTLVKSYSSIDGTDDYKFYDGLILNAYNNGINDYEVTWSNLELGVVTVVPKTEETITVTPTDMKGWAFFQETANGSGEMKFGPATTPLGSGSAKLVVDATGGEIFGKVDWRGVRLADIGTLQYSTYRSVGSSALVPSLQLNIDYDDSDASTSWQGRLVYEPYYSQTVADDTWQEWNTLQDIGDGNWWASGAPGNSQCSQGNPCTWSEVLSAFPNAAIRDADYTGVFFKVGSNWVGGFEGYVDKFVIEDAVSKKTFDFEPAPLPACSASDSVGNTSFDTFTLGNVNGQNAWNSTGSFDQEIVRNTYGYANFGCQSLRISNAVTSGSFGNQTFAAPLTDSVGEVDATAGAFTVGTRRNHYEAQFDIASAVPGAQQAGLSLSVSPDRGDGSRMSYLSFVDSAAGIDVTFYDVQGTSSPVSFVPTVLTTLDRTVPHSVKFVIDAKDGASNDEVQISIDGTVVHTGTTWENYYRFDNEASAEQSPRLIKTLIFRASGTAVAGNAGKGFLLDNMSLVASDRPEPTPPTVTIESPSPAENSSAGGVITGRAVAVDEKGMAGSYLRFWKDSFESGAANLVANCQNAPGGDLLGKNVDTTCEFDSTTSPDGVYVFSAQFIDSDGKWGIAKRTFTVDNTAPTIPTITKPTARQWFKATPILNEWTASTDTNPVTYQIAYSYDDGHTFGGSTCLDVTDIGGKTVSGCRDTASTSRDHSPALSEQGGVTIFVRAVDESGNKSNWSEGVHYYYDAVAPTTDINVSSVVNGVFTVSGTALDNLALNRVYVQLVNRQTNARVGGTTVNLIGTGVSSPWSKEYSGLPDGDYAAHVSVTDMAGNSGSAGWTANFNVTNDVTAPAVPTGLTWTDSASNAVANGGSTELAGGTASWTANAETDFNHYIYKSWNSIATSAYNGEAHAYVVPNVSTTSLSGSFNQGYGTSYFCIAAVDTAGNESACSAPFAITYTEAATPTKTATTVVVSGDTSSGENQIGWLFNRDQGTKTPYEFNTSTSAVGTGSLYVSPIGAINASDKFIAEYFAKVNIADLTSFKFDFKLGSSAELADTQHVYMNVYANFAVSDENKYYDCKYDVLTTAGSKDNFTTVTFDPTQAYTVQKRGDSPENCPTIPANMGPGAKIRAFAINLGDTSVNDADADMYLDKVVMETVSAITTFDLDPTPVVPVVVPPVVNGGGGSGVGGVVLAPLTPITTPNSNPNPTPETPAPEGTPEGNPTPNPQTPTTGGGTGDNTVGGTGIGNTGTGTGGTGGNRGTGGTGGGTAGFNPADATLDAGGGTAIDDTITEEDAFSPADATLDQGGGVVPEETSYMLLWILLGMLALLNAWWFLVAKKRKENN